MATTAAEPDPKRDHLRVRGTVERSEKDKRLFLFEGGDGKFSFAVCAHGTVWAALLLGIASVVPYTKPYIWAILHFFGLHP